jgi:hypothetical protein
LTRLAAKSDQRVDARGSSRRQEAGGECHGEKRYCHREIGGGVPRRSLEEHCSDESDRAKRDRAAKHDATDGQAQGIEENCSTDPCRAGAQGHADANLLNRWQRPELALGLLARSLDLPALSNRSSILDSM